MKFVSLLVDTPLDIMQPCLHSCAGLGVDIWLLTHLTTPAFRLSSTHFLTTVHICFDLPHLIVAHLSWCQCGHTIDNLNTHLLQCIYGNERIIAHDTLRDIVVAIPLESGAHVQKEVSHLFHHHIR